MGKIYPYFCKVTILQFDRKYYILNLLESFNSLTKIVFSSLQKRFIFRATIEDRHTLQFPVASVHYPVQWRRWHRSSYTRFIVIRCYLASKKESPGDSRQSTWSIVLQFDAHADVVENRNYHNDIHICRRIARKILLLPGIVNFV